MIIATINHKSDEGVEKLTRDIEDSLNKYAQLGFKIPMNVLFGPDYATSYDLEHISTTQEREKVIKKMSDISARLPGTIFIPGSMSWQKGKEMYHSAPAFVDGKLINEFYKNTDNGEGQLALRKGLKFIPGECDRNRFNLGAVDFAYQICGDHGKQDVSGCQVELISALDNKAGFYTSVMNDSWPHFGVLTNGLDGKSSCQLYDPSADMKLQEIQPLPITPNLNLYILKKPKNTK